MLDPEVVRRLDGLEDWLEQLDEDHGPRDADALRALKADWERRGEALREQCEATNVMGKAAANLGAKVQALKDALVGVDSLLSLVRHRHRNTPWPDDLTEDVDAVLAKARAALVGKP